jgi:hypothetical protein
VVIETIFKAGSNNNRQAVHLADALDVNLAAGEVRRQQPAVRVTTTSHERQQHNKQAVHSS